MSIELTIIVYAIRMILPMLQYFIKDPNSIASELVILTSLRDTLNQIIAGIPTPTPAPTPTPTPTT